MRRHTWLEASSAWSPTLSASGDLPLPPPTPLPNQNLCRGGVDRESLVISMED